LLAIKETDTANLHFQKNKKSQSHREKWPVKHIPLLKNKKVIYLYGVIFIVTYCACVV
jgi:hypothetical protein